MPAVMHTGEVGVGWTYPQLESTMMAVIAASGWGTPVRVQSAPTDTSRHWYFDEWFGATPSIDLNPNPIAADTITVLNPFARIGRTKAYYVTGNGTTQSPWTRNENYWSFQADGSAYNGQLSTSVGDPFYMFTLTAPDYRCLSWFHRERVWTFHWFVAREQPPLYTASMSRVYVGADNLTQASGLPGYQPGGSTTFNQATGSQGEYNSARNAYTIVSGDYQLFMQAPTPANISAANNKRQVTYNHPLYTQRLFVGMMPLDLAYVAASDMPKWGQLITDSGKRIQMLTNSLNNSLGVVLEG